MKKSNGNFSEQKQRSRAEMKKEQSFKAIRSTFHEERNVGNWPWECVSEQSKCVVNYTNHQAHIVFILPFYRGGKTVTGPLM